MKLSEALIIQTDDQKRLGQLKHWILSNAKVQEDDMIEANATLPTGLVNLGVNRSIDQLLHLLEQL